MLKNTIELQNNKTEDQDIKPLSSVSVPRTGLFYEPFLKDLELIWRVEVCLHYYSPELIQPWIKGCQNTEQNLAKIRNRIVPKYGIHF